MGKKSKKSVDTVDPIYAAEPTQPPILSPESLNMQLIRHLIKNNPNADIMITLDDHLPPTEVISVWQEGWFVKASIGRIVSVKKRRALAQALADMDN